MIKGLTFQETGIAKAIRIAGGQAALAQKLNAGRRGTHSHVSQQSVSQWARQGYAPKKRAVEISNCIGGRVPPGDLVDPMVRQIFNA